MFQTVYRALYRVTPRMETVKRVLLASLSLFATCAGILIRDLMYATSDKAPEAAHRQGLGLVTYLVLGVVVLLPLVHVLVSLKAENDRRQALDDKSAAADAIRFDRRVDRVEIQSARSVRLTWEMDLVSDMDAPCKQIAFPVQFEIASEQDAKAYRTKVTLAGLTVDRADVTAQSRIEFRELRADVDADPTTPSMVSATIPIPVNLQRRGDKSRVVLTVDTRDAFPHMLTGDWLTVDIPYLTRDLVMEVRCGGDFAAGHGVHLKPPADDGHPVEASSFFLRNRDNRETDRANGGIRASGPTVWVDLDSPKTGYRYTVHFAVYPVPAVVRGLFGRALDAVNAGPFPLTTPARPPATAVVPADPPPAG